MTSTIHSTKNYDQFKPLFCNRGKLRIDKNHLSRLEESILNRNLLKHRPILVNKDLEIIDGHHRFEIAKKNNLDIYYTVQDDADYKDAITLTRGVTNWTFKGYIECRALNNEEDYVKLNKFLDENDITVHNLFRLFSTKSHSEYWIAKIKKGTYKFDESLFELVPVIKKIHDIFDALKQNGHKKYKFDKTHFWYGCYLFANSSKVSWTGFKEKLIENGEKLAKKCSTWQEVVAALCRIYNLDRKIDTLTSVMIIPEDTEE